jgi:hypothetical protein
VLHRSAERAAGEALKDATQAFADDLVRQIRVGRQIGTRTRVALDLSGAASYTVYALYSPYGCVIDFARDAGARPFALVRPSAAPPPRPATARPSEPRPNGRGGFSLSRQLGLGVARIVIDPDTAATTPAR